MPTRRRLLAPCGALAVSAVLAGCVAVSAPQPVETRLPPGFDGRRAQTASPSPPTSTDRPTSAATPAPAASPSPSTTDVGARDCGDGGSQTVSGAEQTFRVTGGCTELTVSGTALVIDATEATAATLRISGDRIRVEIAAAGDVVVQGNDGTVTSASGIDRVEIAGERTTTEAAAGIASVTVRGQGNTVRSGGGVGSVVVEGSGNTIG